MNRDTWSRVIGASVSSVNPWAASHRHAVTAAVGAAGSVASGASG